MGVVTDDIPALMARAASSARGPDTLVGSVRDMQRCRAAAMSLDATLGPLPPGADLRRILVRHIQRIRAAQAADPSIAADSAEGAPDPIAQAQSWAHALPLQAAERHADPLGLDEPVGQAALPNIDAWMGLSTRSPQPQRLQMCTRWRVALSAQWRYAMALWALHHLESGVPAGDIPEPPWAQQFPLSLVSLKRPAPTEPASADPYATYHARALVRVLNGPNASLIRQGLVPEVTWKDVRLACAAGAVPVTANGFVLPATMRAFLNDTALAARTITSAASAYPWAHAVPRTWSPGQDVGWER